MSISPPFWKGRRVFVTGHTGFKGSWLCLWLESLGASVAGVALPPATNPSLFECASVNRSVRSTFADIRDSRRLAKLMDAERPEIVFHLAAQPLVLASYDDPVETYSVNVIGTATVLNVVRTMKSVRAFVNVTSDKCYENREWVWPYRENEPMGGYDPYSSSKGCAELVTAAFRNSFFNPDQYENHKVGLATARGGNVIGGGDWAPDRLVPDLVRAFEAQKSAVIRRPNSIRPWQHVLDPLSGYLLLAERLISEGPKYAEAWNFGPELSDSRSVSEVVERFVNLWGNGAAWKVEMDKKLHEATYLKLDCSKAKALLNWRTVWPLDEALAATAEWYRAFYRREEMRSFCLRQIKGYMDDMAESRRTRV